MTTVFLLTHHYDSMDYYAGEEEEHLGIYSTRARALKAMERHKKPKAEGGLDYKGPLGEPEDTFRDGQHWFEICECPVDRDVVIESIHREAKQ